MLDHLVADQPAAIRERQKGHELLRAACRPISLDDLSITDPDTEATQHLNPNVVWRWLHER